MHVSSINNVWAATCHLSCVPGVACADHATGEWDFQKNLAHGLAAAEKLVLKFTFSSLVWPLVSVAACFLSELGSLDVLSGKLNLSDSILTEG